MSIEIPRVRYTDGSDRLRRAMILIQQRRLDLAERELGEALGVEPNNPLAHALLGLCLAGHGRFKEAVRHGETAVGLEPDLPFAHYALAAIVHDAGQLDRALASVGEAIRLEPEESEFFALRAKTLLRKERHADALAAAEAGLRLDPEHVDCLAARAGALLFLGREAEAQMVLDAALALDPESAETHATRGWLHLRQGERDQALGHFREALRLDPMADWARQGLIEALKARSGVYAFLLRTFLRLLTAPRKVRLAVALAGGIGLVGGIIVLAGLALTQPEHRLWLWPTLLLLVCLGFTYPLSNLLLQLDPHGRLALSPKQREEANTIGGLMVVEVVAGVGIVAGSVSLLYLAILGGCLAPLVVYTFQCPGGWPRLLMAGYTVGEAMLGLFVYQLLMFGFTLSSAQAYRFAPFFMLFFLLFVLAVIPGLLLADWLKAPDSLLRRWGRRVSWPNVLTAP